MKRPSEMLIAKTRRAAVAITAAMLILIVGLFAREVIDRLAKLPIPESEKAVNWIDYWLFRYQTMVAGILAVVAGLFAIAAALVSIKYDRQKTTQVNEAARRTSIRSVERAVEYQRALAHTAHLMLSWQRNFPIDPPPEIFVETGALEKTVMSNWTALPSNLANRCLSIAYSLKVSNERLRNVYKTATQPLSFLESFRRKRPFLFSLEAMLAACDIVQAQLIIIASEPTNELLEKTLDYIDSDSMISIFTKWEVPPSRAQELLGQLRLTAVATEELERIVKNR